MNETGLFVFLDQLSQIGIEHRLAYGANLIAVEIAVPGERWHVEFHDDGSVGFERFVSATVAENIDSREVLDALLNRYAEE